MADDFRVKLSTMKITEKRNDTPEININNISISDFNLLIGDNAQGKTRLFQSLYFLANLFTGKPKIISTYYHGTFEFDAASQDVNDKIIYDIIIEPKENKNIFKETITRNGKIIYSFHDKHLYNEISNKNIKNFFIPPNSPALISIADPEFVTINIIRNFFQKIVYISSEKRRDILIDEGSLTPNVDSTNIASVLKSWRNLYPEIFNEVVSEIKDNFPLIKDIFFTEQKDLHTELLTINEQNVDKNILQMEWSDGIIRLLCLLMLPKVPFKIENKVEPPSLILVDEIENGLDYNRLKYIMKYLEDYSDDSQIIVSSHSPLVCDFVHPQNWIVVKRKGSDLNFISPEFVEDDIDKQLDIFKHRHWEFYTKHISNSNRYRMD